MDSPRRRRVLHATGGLLAVGLGGCTSAGTTDERTTTSVADDPTTTAPRPDPSAITLAASVRRQASSDAPARFALTLTNGGDVPAELGFGPALYAGPTRRVADVVLDAVDVGADFDTSRTENCWTVPDEYGTTVRDLEYHRLAPGEEHTERYDVYTVEGASECRPEGTYALSRQLPVRGVADVTAYLRFAINEDGTVSVGNDGTKISLE